MPFPDSPPALLATMRLNLDARTHPLPFWTQRVPFSDAWVPSCPVFEPADPSGPKSSHFWTGRPLLAATCPLFGRTDPTLPLHARFWTRRPLLATTRPFLDTPTPSGRNASRFGCTNPTLPPDARFSTRQPLLAATRSEEHTSELKS